MRAVVFAYHNMGIAGLEALRHAGFNIAAIFSHKDDPGENVWFDSVTEWARESHRPLWAREGRHQGRGDLRLVATSSAARPG